ncbi:unnamed protein product [Dracunculus medinensis]|uniref:Protein SDA1 n=1 Tax=Dracunculus medinensis TaxID=318479 RepID=A0A0N4UGC8_DRAME|nr:unnamed protein product [Dracunculus medinensis]
MLSLMIDSIKNEEDQLGPGLTQSEKILNAPNELGEIDDDSIAEEMDSWDTRIDIENVDNFLREQRKEKRRERQKLRLLEREKKNLLKKKHLKRSDS